MKAATNFRLKNVALIGRGQRRASFFLAVLLITGAARAGQLQPQGAAAELQRRGDLIGAERKLQEGLTEARAAGSRRVEFAQALAVLCVFYQDIGRFSQAESSFNGSLKILRGI